MVRILLRTNTFFPLLSLTYQSADPILTQTGLR